MRQLEHAISEARTVLRRAAARLGPKDPARTQPASLVLRLDDADLPGLFGEGESLSLADWKRVIMSTVAWLGPLPVHVLAGGRADHVWLTELVRFAHRLECPTLLVTNGAHITQSLAEELVDCGLAAARVLMGGVSEAVHHEAVGGHLEDATGAVTALLAAAADREAVLDVEVGIPWQGRVNTEVRAVIGWARERGVQGFRVVAPLRATAIPSDPEVLDALAAEPSPFNRTPPGTFEDLHAMAAHQDGEPGLPRARGHRRYACPVGGQRVEVGDTGKIYSCPFKAAIGVMDEDVFVAWGGAKAHLAAIAACDRACAHPELAPARLLS